MLVGTNLCVLLAAVAAQSGDSPAGLRVLWKVPLGSSSFGGASVADVTGDGIPDVAFCTYFGDSKVRVLRGKDGKELWSYDAAIHPGKGDSCLDASCRFADLLGDGNLELVVPVSNTSQVIAFEAATGKKLWAYEAGLGECIDTPPWIGDIDGDGKPDFAIGSYDGKVYAFQRDGSALWTTKPVERYIMGSAAIADMDGDGKPEVVVAGDKVTALRGADGSVLWSVPFDKPGSYWSVTRGVAVADVDGDGQRDLAALNGHGLFKVLRGRDGATLHEFDAAAEFDGKVEMNSHLPVIADLDGNGKVDVFFVVGQGVSDHPETNGGVAVCLTGFAGPAKNADGSPNGWFMHRHDPQNTGNVRTDLPAAVLERLTGARRPEQAE